MNELIQDIADKRTNTHRCASNHGAYLVRPGKMHCPFNPAYFGSNYYYGDFSTMHAETNVINKVSKKHREKAKKRNKYVYDLIVIRVSASGCTLGNSLLCKHCIHSILETPKRTGIKIRKIYYSNEEGEIIKTTPLQLSLIESPYVSSFYNHRGYKSLFDKYNDVSNLMKV